MSDQEKSTNALKLIQNDLRHEVARLKVELAAAHDFNAKFAKHTQSLAAATEIRLRATLAKNVTLSSALQALHDTVASAWRGHVKEPSARMAMEMAAQALRAASHSPNDWLSHLSAKNVDLPSQGLARGFVGNVRGRAGRWGRAETVLELMPESDQSGIPCMIFVSESAGIEVAPFVGHRLRVVISAGVDANGEA